MNHTRANQLSNLLKNGAHKVYECPECGLHYKQEVDARSCQAWCSQYKSCSLEITKNSEEDLALKNTHQETE